MEGRDGFRRLLAEVAVDRVGLVLGIDMSRLARSCKDWYHLLELCARYGTLLADQDGLYDPREFNDRLLLGLKGTMSEAELYVLHQRMRQGILNKARRGELLSHPPIGYVRDPAVGVALDPDEQVRHAVGMVFELFDELGSINDVTRYLRREGMLTAEGHRPALGRCGFTKDIVNRLLAPSAVPTKPKRRTSYADAWVSDEWWLADLASEVGIRYVSLHAWIRRGWVRARKVPSAAGMQAVSADTQELRRFRRLRDHRREHPYRPPADLITCSQRIPTEIAPRS